MNEEESVMTREEIMAMKPGRKIEKLIKEYIFNVDLSGFQWARVGNSMFKNTDESVTWIDIPNSSADISAAWEVVENTTIKSEKDGCGPIVELSHDGMWHMRIGEKIVQGKTAPEAICKSALLAVLDL